MKIIDERGMLFGKVNIIDFLAVLSLFFLVPVVYLGNKIFLLQERSQRPLIENEMVEIELPFNLIKIKPDTLSLIKAGDKELDRKGKQMGEITWVGESSSFIYTFTVNPQSKASISKTDTTLYQLPVKLKLMAEVRGDTLYYKEKQITDYSRIYFETDKYSLFAELMLPKKEKKEKWVQARIKFSGVFLELSKIISSGQVEKDDGRRVIARLKEIVSSKSSEAQALKLEENKFVLIVDPYRNDITALFDLLCVEEDGEYFFKNQPVKIGSQITFSSELYLVSGLVIGISN